jgi:cytochrome c-type biogenesis protein CcmH
VTRRRWAPWAALAVVVGVALVIAVARSQPSDDPEARARRLERRIACPVCTGESVAESNAPESRAIRADIRDRIGAGQDDAEIVQAYVDLYGERVRLNPEGEGLGLLAWGIPVVAVVAGGATLALAVRRWVSEPRLTPTDDDDEVVRRARARHGDRDAG